MNQYKLDFEPFLAWYRQRGRCGIHGYILPNGELAEFEYHQDVYKYIEVLIETKGEEFEIFYDKWCKEHPLISSYYMDARFIEENLNIIRIRGSSYIELLSTHNPTNEQWKFIKTMLENSKTIVDITDLKKEASKYSLGRESNHYIVQLDDLFRASEKLTRIKTELKEIKKESS